MCIFVHGRALSPNKKIYISKYKKFHHFHGVQLNSKKVGKKEKILKNGFCIKKGSDFKH